MVSIVEGCVNVSRSNGLCRCMVYAACVMSHVSILRSGVCPSILHLTFSDWPRADVVPGWNLTRSSLMEAFGSRRLSLK